MGAMTSAMPEEAWQNARRHADVTCDLAGFLHSFAPEFDFLNDPFQNISTGMWPKTVKRRINHGSDASLVKLEWPACTASAHAA
jgi:hypothetical protein